MRRQPVNAPVTGGSAGSGLLLYGSLLSGSLLMRVLLPGSGGAAGLKNSARADYSMTPDVGMTPYVGIGGNRVSCAIEPGVDQRQYLPVPGSKVINFQRIG